MGLWGLEDWNSGIMRGVEDPMGSGSGLVVHDFCTLGLDRGIIKVYMYCRTWAGPDSLFSRFSQTTIMAVQFDGGVVLGADSRTTTG